MDDNDTVVKLTDQSEVLFRHVYPSWLDDDGWPSSQAFYPWSEADEGKLSTDRSEKTTPAASFALATAEPPAGFGLNSCGIWGLSVGEVCEHELVPLEDPIPATEIKPANPAHALVDFNAHPEKKRKNIGRKLKVRAIARNKIYPSEKVRAHLQTAHSPGTTTDNGA